MWDSDVMKPAVSWAEAAMLMANLRTISGGAALKCVQADAQHMDQELKNGVFVTAQTQEMPPTQEADTVLDRMYTLRRAAFRQIMDQRTKICVR